MGLVLLKGVNEELDFKASLDYIDQRFQIASLNQQLFGSSFSETYTRTFTHKILSNEQGNHTGMEQHQRLLCICQRRPYVPRVSPLRTDDWRAR